MTHQPLFHFQRDRDDIASPPPKAGVQNYLRLSAYFSSMCGAKTEISMELLATFKTADSLQNNFGERKDYVLPNAELKTAQRKAG
jgi:hypothetical protein